MTEFNRPPQPTEGGMSDRGRRDRVHNIAAGSPPRPPSPRDLSARIPDPSGSTPDFTRRRMIAGLAALSVAGIGYAAIQSRRDGEPTTTEPGDGSTPDLAPIGSSSAVPLPSAEPATVPVTAVPFTRVIGQGMVGDDVRTLQQRLTDLAFDPGSVDGQFGEVTRQAVWAFQKLVLKVPRQEISDAVDESLWQAIHSPIVVFPRRPELTSTHVEVYLPEQVLIVFLDNAPRLITHISSGSGEDWCEEVTIDPGEQGNEKGTEPLVKGICGKSLTTGGTFTFNRRYVTGDGWRTGSLGRMFKPVYFNYGLAVHGSSNVPAKPASHGCVRTPMHIADYFPDLVANGDDIWLWDGVEEPEHYGQQQPYFDRRDPDWVPPSTTTTSTTSTTTAAPATTVAPTTTAASTTTRPATTAPPPATTTPPISVP